MENKFEPDWCSPPGDTLRELMDERGLSPKDLAIMFSWRRRGIQRVKNILTGTDEISVSTAIKLETTFNLPATFWLNRELQYRQCLIRLGKKPHA